MVFGLLSPVNRHRYERAEDDHGLDITKLPPEPKDAWRITVPAVLVLLPNRFS